MSKADTESKLRRIASPVVSSPHEARRPPIHVQKMSADRFSHRGGWHALCSLRD
jgi:hypothetical protein